VRLEASERREGFNQAVKDQERADGHNISSGIKMKREGHRGGL
jgi:hypothetical protein